MHKYDKVKIHVPKQVFLLYWLKLSSHPLQILLFFRYFLQILLLFFTDITISVISVKG